MARRGTDTSETTASVEPVGYHGPEASKRLAKLLPADRGVRLQTNRDQIDWQLHDVWAETNEGGRYPTDEATVRDGVASSASPLLPPCERAEWPC